MIGNQQCSTRNQILISLPSLAAGGPALIAAASCTSTGIAHVLLTEDNSNTKKHPAFPIIKIQSFSVLAVSRNPIKNN